MAEQIRTDARIQSQGVFEMAAEEKTEPICMEIYFDESGSRFPDLKGDLPPSTRDFFALGGILFETQDIHRIISAYDFLRTKWNITYPLHSNSIRFETDEFTWLKGLDGGKKQEFYRDLDSMIEQQPFVALACVINRPGYNARYKKLYGDQRWMLCKTAFAILVERAAKFASSRGRRLRVHFEESEKREDRDIVQYQKELKKTGCRFLGTLLPNTNPLPASRFKKFSSDPLKDTRNPLCSANSRT